MGLAIGCKEAKNLAVTRKKKCFLPTICHFERFQVTVAQKKAKILAVSHKSHHHIKTLEEPGGSPIC